MNCDYNALCDKKGGYIYEECGYVQTGVLYEEVKSHVVHFNNSFYDYKLHNFSGIKVGSEVLFHSLLDCSSSRYIEPEHMTVISVIRNNKDILFVVDKKVCLSRRSSYRVYIVHSSLQSLEIVNHPDGSITLGTIYKIPETYNISDIIHDPEVIAEHARLMNLNYIKNNT